MIGCYFSCVSYCLNCSWFGFVALGWVLRMLWWLVGGVCWELVGIRFEFCLFGFCDDCWYWFFLLVVFWFDLVRRWFVVGFDD